MQYVTQFESLLRRLDRQFGSVEGTVPGAIVSRCLLKEGGIGWMLCLGTMNSAKSFFSAKTIRGCVGKARRAILKGQTTPLTLSQVLQASEKVLARTQTQRSASNGKRPIRRTARKAE